MDTSTVRYGVGSVDCVENSRAGKSSWTWDEKQKLQVGVLVETGLCFVRKISEPIGKPAAATAAAGLRHRRAAFVVCDGGHH